MAPSSQGKAALDQKILARIRAAVGNLANLRTQIGNEGIKGDTEEELKKLLVEIINKIEVESELLLQEIEEITDNDTKISRSDQIHRNLELFLFHVELIRTATAQVPTELYFVTKATLRWLGHQDVRVVLIPEDSLGTTNLSDALLNLFKFFDSVLTYIKDSFPFYWIILVPPSFIRTPLNWPLITHEIGHILERQKWQIVNGYYPYPVVPSLSQPDMSSNYAQEFQADFVAVSRFGPIFARRLLESYYTREIVISRTHPSWKERFEAIAAHLQDRFPDEADELRKVSAGEEPSMIPRGSIVRLPNIISQTEVNISATNCRYVQDVAMENRARTRLDRFAAYTEDMRALLNVADRSREKLLEAATDPTEKGDIERQFDYLLMDSIRLNYIRDLVEPAMLEPNESTPASC